MPMFVVLSKLTAQGAQNLRQLPEFVRRNQEGAQKRGIKVHGFYVTQGRYDIIVVAEAPDAETMASQVLSVVGRGNTSSETLRAYTLEEFQSILQRVD